MYIEREDILYSVELLDQSLMRSVTFNPFIHEIFALPFDSGKWECSQRAKSRQEKSQYLQPVVREE